MSLSDIRGSLRKDDYGLPAGDIRGDDEQGQTTTAGMLNLKCHSLEAGVSPASPPQVVKGQWMSQ